MFVHAERYPSGDVKVFYGSIGLALSENDGRTWRFLGEIFRPDLSLRAVLVAAMRSTPASASS